jgi:hypothetical protein
MNAELKALCEQAGCPEEVMNTLWFNIFIQKYTHFLLEKLEQECA